MPCHVLIQDVLTMVEAVLKENVGVTEEGRRNLQEMPECKMCFIKMYLSKIYY